MKLFFIRDFHIRVTFILFYFSMITVNSKLHLFRLIIGLLYHVDIADFSFPDSL